MPRYKVRVRFSVERDIDVGARGEQQAEERAVEIVEGWNNVVDAEALDVEEE